MQGLVAKLLVHLLGDVRRKGVQKLQQRMQLIPCETALGVHVVDKAHHGGDGRVELHALDILRDLPDAGMQARVQLRARNPLPLHQLGHAPYAVEEAAAALRSLLVPGNGLVERAHEHDVHAEGIRAELIDIIVGVYDVAAGLGHLLAIGPQHHAMARSLLIGFLRGYESAIVEEFVPEARVQQMQRRMLHAAVVPVHGHPVVQRLLPRKGPLVVGVAVAQEVPAGAGPVGHGIRFPNGLSAALWAGGMQPVLRPGQTAGTVVRGRKIIQHGQRQRKLILRQRHPAALVAVYQRDRLAPIALAGKHPVAELIVDLPLADALLFQMGDHRRNGLADLHAVEKARVHHSAVAALGIGFLFNVAARYHLHNRQAKLLCKGIVTLVVGRHGHDRARSVAHEHIV